jgi:GR25 family glycosyltransferase involved in LPS biosynthesis
MVLINNEEFTVNHNEFNKVICEKFCNLNIISKLGYFERIISLITELSKYLEIKHGLFIDPDHGGFIPIKCSTYLTDINILNTSFLNQSNISKNIINHKHSTSNIFFNSIENINSRYKELRSINPTLLYSDNFEKIDYTIIQDYRPFIITTLNENLKGGLYNNNVYNISNTNLYLYIPENYSQQFMINFHYFIQKNTKTLNYDNLIHLCIMVKNGGDEFEQMLIDNYDNIDRWTILDTGSTDGTINSINKILVGKKKGKLYKEPFLNFRDSRNRCLDLAGTECKYNLMLDDTYITDNKLKIFLNEVRGDQNADSFSIFVKSDDVEYLSNRVTKVSKNLRYIYTMHEIIQDKDNMNVGVPLDACHIFDRSTPFMKNRTDERKDYDLKCLFEMINDYPDEPRHIFYIAQSYKMMKEYKLAAEYYFKRAFHIVDGFDQEKMDALFEYTRISQFELKMDWDKCEKLYKICTEWQPTRPEGDYMIGIHYYTAGDKKTAFEYLKKAHRIGFPYHQQYSLKPTLSFLFIPYYMVDLCYEFKDYQLGLECCILYLQKNIPTSDYYDLIKDWYQIYLKLVQLPPLKINPIIPVNPIFCFIADGGFTKWSGKNILTNGIGGSETWIIEMARYIKQLTNYEVVVFCNCEEDEFFEGVEYIQLPKVFSFITNYKVDNCIISRFSEYIPTVIQSHVENIHVILHDIRLTGNIIPISTKLKNFFCLTEWHKTLFLQNFKLMEKITHPMHYGIDFDNFLLVDSIIKVKNSFIYSSFPNKGLLILLKMWPQIQSKYSDATLNIFTDVTNAWANSNYPSEMKKIIDLLYIYKSKYTNITNHGWVDKKTLGEYWKKSHIWFYPCKFVETFCLTALEAAVSKTIAITNDLGALQDTVGNRGIIIPGNSETDEWQSRALNHLFTYMDTPENKKYLIQKNYEWALEHSWKNRASKLLNIINNSNNNLLNSIKPEQPIQPIQRVQSTSMYKNIKFTIQENEELLSVIDKIYYINLDSRPDRNDHFLNQLKIHDIPSDKVARIIAIDGKKYNFAEQELNLFRNIDYANMETKLNIMGNQLSHYYIFKHMIQNNYKQVIICQDDIVFKQGFNKYIDELVANLPSDAEIVHFGFHKYRVRDVYLPWDLTEFEQDDELSFGIVNKNVCRLEKKPKALYNCNNSMGYILTLQGAINYTQYAEKNGFTFAADHEMNNYLIQKNIYYGSRTVLATTNPSFGSDIFENTFNKNNDRSKKPYKSL